MSAYNKALPLKVSKIVISATNAFDSHDLVALGIAIDLSHKIAGTAPMVGYPTIGANAKALEEAGRSIGEGQDHSQVSELWAKFGVELSNFIGVCDPLPDPLPVDL